MSTPLRKCHGGITKHSWEWLRNVNVTSYNSRGEVKAITLKGRYRCRNLCGAHKHGPYNMNVTPPTEVTTEASP